MGARGVALLSASGKDMHRSLIIPHGKAQHRTKVQFDRTTAGIAPQAHPELEELEQYTISIGLTGDC